MRRWLLSHRLVSIAYETLEDRTYQQLLILTIQAFVSAIVDAWQTM